jgi:hypothetical protein
MLLAEGARSDERCAQVSAGGPAGARHPGEALRVQGHWLGELDLKAEAVGDEWRIEKLDISNPHSKFASNGVWRRTGTGSLTTLNLKMEASDLERALHAVRIRRLPEARHRRAGRSAVRRDFRTSSPSATSPELSP